MNEGCCARVWHVGKKWNDEEVIKDRKRWIWFLGDLSVIGHMKDTSRVHSYCCCSLLGSNVKTNISAHVKVQWETTALSNKCGVPTESLRAWQALSSILLLFNLQTDTGSNRSSLYLGDWSAGRWKLASLCQIQPLEHTCPRGKEKRRYLTAIIKRKRLRGFFLFWWSSTRYFFLEFFATKSAFVS